MTAEQDIIEHADSLLRETAQLRSEAQRFEQVHGMYLLPKLPKDLSRNEAVYILDPSVIHEAREARARIMTFDTEIQCIPTERTSAGTIKTSVQKKADALEAAAAVWLNKIDPDQVTKGRVIHKQLVEPLAITILEMCGVESPDPSMRDLWKWFDIDLEGCGWLETNNIPSIFARRYWEYVFNTEELYSGRKDGAAPGAMLRKENGKWDFKKASDDTGKYRGAGVDSSNDRYSRCEKVWLDDSKTISHVVLNDRSTWSKIVHTATGRTPKAEGKIVWQGENPFGRVSAYLTGSNVTPARLMHDHYLPYYLDLITVSEQENVIESIRATASRNRASPRDYWKPDPEAMGALLARYGSLDKVPAIEWGDGRTVIGYGELMSRPMDVDPDMAILANDLALRKQRFAQSSALQDPDVLKNATLGAQLASYDAAAASLSLIIGPDDVLRRQLIESWEHSMVWLQEKYPEYAEVELQATGYEPSLSGGKRLAGGETHKLTGKDFQDVKHSWKVITSQRTRGQATSEFEAALETMAPLADGRPGIGIYEDLFRAKGVSDVNERRVILAKEALIYDPGYQGYIDQQVKASIEAEIEADSGLQLGLLTPVTPMSGDPNAATTTPTDVPGGNQTNSPVTEPAVGGSGANMTAG